MIHTIQSGSDRPENSSLIARVLIGTRGNHTHVHASGARAFSFPLIDGNQSLPPPSYPTCMHACMHACVHACMHACMHACVHACMHARIGYRWACAHACGSVGAKDQQPGAISSNRCIHPTYYTRAPATIFMHMRTRADVRTHTSVRITCEDKVSCGCTGATEAVKCHQDLL